MDITAGLNPVPSHITRRDYCSQAKSTRYPGSGAAAALACRDKRGGGVGEPRGSRGGGPHSAGRKGGGRVPGEGPREPDSGPQIPLGQRCRCGCLCSGGGALRPLRPREPSSGPARCRTGSRAPLCPCTTSFPHNTLRGIWHFVSWAGKAHVTRRKCSRAAWRVLDADCFRAFRCDVFGCA